MWVKTGRGCLVGGASKGVEAALDFVLDQADIVGGTAKQPATVDNS